VKLVTDFNGVLLRVIKHFEISIADFIGSSEKDKIKKERLAKINKTDVIATPNRSIIWQAVTGLQSKSDFHTPISAPSTCCYHTPINITSNLTSNFLRTDTFKLDVKHSNGRP